MSSLEYSIQLILVLFSGYINNTNLYSTMLGKQALGELIKTDTSKKILINLRGWKTCLFLKLRLLKLQKDNVYDTAYTIASYY